MDEFDALRERLIRQQKVRGFTEFFATGDLVGFPLGAFWNIHRDYEITAVYSTGFLVKAVDADAPPYSMPDKDCLNLGMTHSPFQG